MSNLEEVKSFLEKYILEKYMKIIAADLAPLVLPVMRGGIVK
jgi:hypothetical protein